MARPGFQTLMRPVLRRLAGQRQTTAELAAGMADEFRLADGERLQPLPSGKQATIANRVHWALSYLGRAGSVIRVSRAVPERADPGLPSLGLARWVENVGVKLVHEGAAVRR